MPLQSKILFFLPFFFFEVLKSKKILIDKMYFDYKAQPLRNALH